jgi:hypothetical protein
MKSLESKKLVAEWIIVLSRPGMLKNQVPLYAGIAVGAVHDVRLSQEWNQGQGANKVKEQVKLLPNSFRMDIILMTVNFLQFMHTFAQ